MDGHKHLLLYHPTTVANFYRAHLYLIFCESDNFFLFYLNFLNNAPTNATDHERLNLTDDGAVRIHDRLDLHRHSHQ